VFATPWAFHCLRPALRADLCQPGIWVQLGMVTFGKIYAEALAMPAVRETFASWPK
jgi:hypothetical protein